MFATRIHSYVPGRQSVHGRISSGSRLNRGSTIQFSRIYLWIEYLRFYKKKIALVNVTDNELKGISFFSLFTNPRDMCLLSCSMIDDCSLHACLLQLNFLSRVLRRKKKNTPLVYELLSRLTSFIYSIGFKLLSLLTFCVMFDYSYYFENMERVCLTTYLIQNISLNM
jgi:hypothetical protein